MEKQADEAIDQVVEIATTYGIDIVGALAILIIGWIAAGWAGPPASRSVWPFRARCRMSPPASCC
mgnify:CR=1 FL=1